MKTSAFLLRYLRLKLAVPGYRLLRSAEIGGARIGLSELACHTGVAGRTVRFGVVGAYGYAYLVLSDGSLADGLLHRLSDGSVVLS